MDDRPGSDVSVVLSADALVYVALPTLTKDAAATLDDEDFPRAQYTKLMQRAVVEALEAQGIETTTADEDGASTLRVRVAGFGRGNGTTSIFVRGGLEDSSLDGSAVLVTPSGKRELEIEGACANGEPADAGDSTHQNMKTFAAALAERITS